MTNIEFYKDKLLEIADAGTVIAIVDGKPTDGCRDLKCEECDRCDKCTDADLLKWLLSEHTEETVNYKICKNLKVDDKILVSNTDNFWYKRYFAGYDLERDSVLAFDSGATSWTADKGCVSHWRYVKMPEEDKK